MGFKFDRGQADIGIMKATLLFIFLSLSSFANAEDLPPCDRHTWRDYKKGKCTLKNADLRGVDLRGQDLSGADLEGTDFTGALLGGADFSNSKNIAKAKYDGARGINRAKGLNEALRLAIAEVKKEIQERIKKRKEAEDKQKRDSENLLRILHRRLAKKIVDNGGLNTSDRSIECRYVPADPVYIKTKGCGGICSGVVKCNFYRVPSKDSFLFSVAVTCESKGDDCPSANDCFMAKKPEKTFFVGTPSEYKEQYKTEPQKPDQINIPSKSRATQ